jgi:hypothetical protein
MTQDQVLESIYTGKENMSSTINNVEINVRAMNQPLSQILEIYVRDEVLTIESIKTRATIKWNVMKCMSLPASRKNVLPPSSGSKYKRNSKRCCTFSFSSYCDSNRVRNVKV